MKASTPRIDGTTPPMLTLLPASNDLNERLLPMMRIGPMAKKIPAAACTA